MCVCVCVWSLRGNASVLFRQRLQIQARQGIEWFLVGGSLSGRTGEFVFEGFAHMNHVFSAKDGFHGTVIGQDLARFGIEQVASNHHCMRSDDQVAQVDGIRAFWWSRVSEELGRSLGHARAGHGQVGRPNATGGGVVLGALGQNADETSLLERRLGIWLAVVNVFSKSCLAVEQHRVISVVLAATNAGVVHIEFVPSGLVLLEPFFQIVRAGRVLLRMHMMVDVRNQEMAFATRHENLRNAPDLESGGVVGLREGGFGRSRLFLFGGEAFNSLETIAFLCRWGIRGGFFVRRHGAFAVQRELRARKRWN